MRPSFILGALSVALSLVGAAGGDHCTTYSTSDPEIDTTVAPGGFFYIDNDLCQPECLFSIWYYQESNDIPGLQRGDEVVDDTCHGMIEADSIICGLFPIGILTGDRRENKALGAAAVGAALLGATIALPTAAAC